MSEIKRRKNPYIPHLAEFYFKPKFNWSIAEARELFLTPDNSILDKIYYRDCIVGMKDFPADSVDLVIADCPYGIGFSGKEGFYNRDKSKVIDGYVEVEGDYSEFSLAWISELPRLMRKYATAFIFSGWTNLKQILDAIDKVGLTLLNHIIWHFNFPPFTRRKFSSSHYHILFVAKNEGNYFFHKIRHYKKDVWVIKRDYSPKQEKNGTKLPERLIQRCIDFGSKPGGIILDPFMGNGTTATTAKANFRHYLGFEINAKMQPIIEANLQKVTLGQAYIPYWDRIPTIKELSLKYPRAYQEFLRREANKANKLNK